MVDLDLLNHGNAVGQDKIEHDEALHRQSHGKRVKNLLRHDQGDDINDHQI